MMPLMLHMHYLTNLILIYLLVLLATRGFTYKTSPQPTQPANPLSITTNTPNDIIIMIKYIFIFIAYYYI